jgi:hypothetical protein
VHPGHLLAQRMKKCGPRGPWNGSGWCDCPIGVPGSQDNKLARRGVPPSCASKAPSGVATGAGTCMHLAASIAIQSSSDRRAASL